jgi:Family of unknown function (DUF6318)
VRRSSRTWGVGLAGACLVIGGCSGGEDPAPGPTSTASATSSPSTTAPTTTAVSDIPVAARAHTPAGAEAFVRFFIDRVNYAWMTPEAGVIEALGDPGCLSCAALEKTAVGLVKAKTKYAATPIDVKDLHPVSGAPSGQQYLKATLVQNRVNIVDPRGKTVSTDPKLTAGRTFALVWKEGEWSVYDIAG